MLLNKQDLAPEKVPIVNTRQVLTFFCASKQTG
jgi:hypothetical protein